jgi:hypothetical protein
MSGVYSSRSPKTAAKEVANYNADPYATIMQERNVTLNQLRLWVSYGNGNVNCQF